MKYVNNLLNIIFSSHRSDGVMRTMNTEKLLKTIPIIQNQMDVLLDFNVSSSVLAELVNICINNCDPLPT